MTNNESLAELKFFHPYATIGSIKRGRPEAAEEEKMDLITISGQCDKLHKMFDAVATGNLRFGSEVATELSVVCWPKAAKLTFKYGEAVKTLHFRPGGAPYSTSYLPYGTHMASANVSTADKSTFEFFKKQVLFMRSLLNEGEEGRPYEIKTDTWDTYERKDWPAEMVRGWYGEALDQALVFLDQYLH